MVNRERVSPQYRLSPPGEFDAFSAHLESLWAQLLRGRPQQPQYSPGGVRPAVDVYETADAVVVVLEAPGMRDRELRLEFDAGRLTIYGEKRNRHCSDEHVYNQVEIACGPFLLSGPALADRPRSTEHKLRGRLRRDSASARTAANGTPSPDYPAPGLIPRSPGHPQAD